MSCINVTFISVRKSKQYIYLICVCSTSGQFHVHDYKHDYELKLRWNDYFNRTYNLQKTGDHIGQSFSNGTLGKS